MLNFITKNSEDVNEVKTAKSMLRSRSLQQQQQQQQLKQQQELEQLQQLQQQQEQQTANQNLDFSYDSPIVDAIRKKVKSQKQTYKTRSDPVKNAEIVIPAQTFEIPVQTPPRLPKNVPIYVNGNQKIRLTGLGANPNCQVQYVFQDESPQHEYCICPDLSYGFQCNEGFGNPCSSMREQFHVASPKLPKSYFIHCNWNIPYLKMCPQNLVW